MKTNTDNQSPNQLLAELQPVNTTIATAASSSSNINVDWQLISPLSPTTVDTQSKTDLNSWELLTSPITSSAEQQHLTAIQTSTAQVAQETLPPASEQPLTQAAEAKPVQGYTFKKSQILSACFFASVVTLSVVGQLWGKPSSTPSNAKPLTLLKF